MSPHCLVLIYTFKSSLWLQYEEWNVAVINNSNPTNVPGTLATRVLQFETVCS
jgi:hypothetical protein